jgi:glutamate dehydrogenase
VVELLQWLLDDHLVMLGWRSYDVDWSTGHPVLSIREASGRGILRDASQSRFGTPTDLDTIDPDVRASILDQPLLRITRTNRSATVHRLRRMLDVTLNIRDDQGRVVSVHRLLGLLSATGLAVPSARTPVLRRRLERVLELEDVVAGSYEENTIVGLFQSLPKDELLEQSVDELRTLLVALLEAQEQRRIRALVRIDHSTHTVTVVLAVPSRRVPAGDARTCHGTAGQPRGQPRGR